MMYYVLELESKTEDIQQIDDGESLHLQKRHRELLQEEWQEY